MDFFSFVLDISRMADLDDHLRYPGQPSMTDIDEHPDIGLKATGVKVNWQTTRY